MAVQTQIQARRGTAATWTSTNPTLAAGETGYETDTGKFKIGTGSTAWVSLGYFNQDPVTTKGDLFTFSTTDARLAVGNNGETLVADSGATTGLRYSATPSASNPVLNSAFQIAQRGTSFTNGNSLSTYGLDRWQIYSSTATGRTWSQQNTSDTTNLPNIQYCQRVARNVSDTLTNGIFTLQGFESVNSKPFAGKTITFSYYARKGANYSSASSALNVELNTGTGTDQNSLSGFTGVVTNSSTATLTTTWTRFTTTVAIGATVNQIALQFGFTPVGTAGAADYFEITGVQLDIGSVALPYRTNGGTFQGELAACQRYYWRNSGAIDYSPYAMGIAYLTTEVSYLLSYPVPMRTPPTSVDYANVGVLFPGGGVGAISALAIDRVNSLTATVYVTGATGLTQFRPYYLSGAASTTNYFGFSAEL